MPVVAGAVWLIRSVLAATAVQHLNLATLTRQGETFVDPELRDSYKKKQSVKRGVR